MPAAVKVAVVFLAAFVPLTAEDAPALGGVVAVQLYVRLTCPYPRPPRAHRACRRAVNRAGVAPAAVATVGAWFVTVTAPLPPTAPLAAVTVPLAEVLGAVNRPLALIVPTARSSST